MIKVMPYNGYRNLFRCESPEEAAGICLDYLEYTIRHEGEIGAILLEPIRATDTHIPPLSYFARLREICDAHGILLIFDEIPTALMRSGTFYVHQRYGIEPDLLVLGKGLGGGVLPQAAVLVKTKYDIAGDISLGHYTHEKPALGSAAICATINYIDNYKLEANCHSQSLYAEALLQRLYEKYDCIGDIRIAGLLITLELVIDRKTKEKHDNLAEKLLYYCLENGLSFKVSGGNCITWHPPLIVSKSQLEFAVDLLEDGLKKFYC
ncbi:4-aminobutyrate aminotransferase-like enzyme [Cytobacillus purgationiresistens]|uniref:4-aminobutyrate aminotransferase-like enzyme n=1 Tax=Cytobacillus purgationiresistens TaxID=863449 RepID=A0ABU0AMU2_9BACI|nr:4-aminobutyrate aminotransferase-like enzyme [Cytobacillus purgationiresistens]